VTDGGAKDEATLDPVVGFEALARDRLPALYRLALLLTGNDADAEDLTQTTLTKGLASWSTVRVAQEPAAYLTTIMVNTSRSWRRRLLQERALSPDPRFEDRVDCDTVEHRRDLVSALVDLPPRQRLAVVLRYCMDLSERDAASILHCSTATVRSQASRGIAKLRTHPALEPDSSDSQRAVRS
jgi:RNA polymerase sigma-70 factor (sigma-E family)